MSNQLYLDYTKFTDIENVTHNGWLLYDDYINVYHIDYDGELPKQSDIKDLDFLKFVQTFYEKYDNQEVIDAFEFLCKLPRG